MRVLVYGGRDFADAGLLYRRLDILRTEAHVFNDPLVIIQGDARGADRLAKHYAIKYGVAHEDFPAAWEDLEAMPCKVKVNPQTGELYNALAGFNRNQQMIDLGEPDMAIECKGEKGTADMRSRLLLAKIPIITLP